MNKQLTYIFIYSEIRKRSYAETAQFQENFEVYIQALISQCLDANFLDEVFSDQGKKIQSEKLVIWEDIYSFKI